MYNIYVYKKLLRNLCKKKLYYINIITIYNNQPRCSNSQYDLRSKRCSNDDRIGDT